MLSFGACGFSAFGLSLNGRSFRGCVKQNVSIAAAPHSARNAQSAVAAANFHRSLVGQRGEAGGVGAQTIVCGGSIRL